LAYADHHATLDWPFCCLEKEILMLDHLQQRIVETLAAARTVTLATYGPASIRANVFPCEAGSDGLYLLVPRTSDHLFNIESNPSVVATTENWQLYAIAEPLMVCPGEMRLGNQPDAAWSAVVRLAPVRLHIAPVGQPGCSETIDVR
jgi:hypothetical protein